MKTVSQHRLSIYLHDETFSDSPAIDVRLPGEGMMKWICI